MERRYGIRAYDYWWGYTSAQIDLMIADQPLVVYPKDKGEKKAPTRKTMDDFADKWMAKKQGKTLSGQKISLDEYLRNGIS